jgi:hypothetical protein
MATTEITAGRRWRKSILLRLAKDEIRFTEVPISHTKSTFVLSYRNTVEKKAVDQLLRDVQATMEEREAERRFKEQWTKDEEARVKLARLNFFRRLTFRKPLAKLSV